MRTDKAVNSLQAKKERTFHVNTLVEAYASLSKKTLCDSFSASTLLLIFS